MRRGRQARERHPVPSRAMADEHSSVAEPVMDPKTDGDAASPFLGPNAWLVEEMYEQFRERSRLGQRHWQEFFADYRPRVPASTARRAARGRGRRRGRPPPRPRRRARPGRAAPAAAPPRAATAPPSRWASRSAAPAPHRRQHGAQPRRSHGHQLPQRPGQAARGQPQGHQRLPQPHRAGQGQLHPPHRLRHRPGDRRRRARHEQRRSSRAPTASPASSHHEHVNIGLAVDVDKSDGSRTLVVPVIRDADTLDFAGFLAAYEDLIRKVRTTSSPSTTSRAPPSRSPTPARSAPSSACPG